MLKKIFLFHSVLFVVLGFLLYLSDSLTFGGSFINIFYAISSFAIFILIWRATSILKSKWINGLVVLIYYHYLFLTYILFELGKETLGVPMTLKMVFPYFENFSLLLSLVSASAMIIAVLGYLLLFIFILIRWNKIFSKVVDQTYQFPSAKDSKTKLGFAFIGLMLVVFLVKMDLFLQKFNEHKINEPYLTLLFFDDAFNRQKENGEQNILEMNKYFSEKGNNKNVVLIIVDALRPDFFMSEENLTPFIDSLLITKEFSIQKNMFATTAFSFNGISSTLSSSRELYENNFFLHDVLKKLGYEVNMILSGDMSNFWNLKDHIKTASVDRYSDGYENFKFGKSDNLNDDQQNILLQLDELKPHSKPTFFYFHMMSVHQIGRLDDSFKRFQPSTVDLNSSDFNDESLENDYKNRMIQLDSYIRQVFDILKSKGYLDNAVFVITADHGQSLGEGGIYFHSKHINNESIRVPFISNIEKSFDDEKVTSQLDIAPTILEDVNLKIPSTWQGISITDSIPKTVFQNQGYEYAMIWKENQRVYQFFYNQKEKVTKLLNISKDSQDKIHSIHKNYDPQKLDSLQQVLFRKFDLEVPIK